MFNMFNRPSGRQVRPQQKSGALRGAALSTGAAVASVALVGFAPAPAPSVPDAAPVVQVHDVELTAFDITGIEAFFVWAAREVLGWFGLGDLTPAEFVTKFGLGDVTPDQLVHFTGIGDSTLNQWAHFLGSNPISALMAMTGLSDDTKLGDAATNLLISGQHVSNLMSLAGLSDTTTLSDATDSLGVGGQDLVNLMHLVGFTDMTTLSQAADSLGLSGQEIDTLLTDWGVGPQHINDFLAGMGITPTELLGILDVTPADLPAGMWDPATSAFTSGTTVAGFADAAGFGGTTTVGDLLSDPTLGLGGASLGEALTGIGLGDTSSVDEFLSAIGMGGATLGGLLSGFGLSDSSTLGDLLSTLGMGDSSLGDLLSVFGLSSTDTVNDLFGIGSIGDSTVNSLIADWGIGDEGLADIATSMYGTETVDELLTNILAALTAP